MVYTPTVHQRDTKEKLQREQMAIDWNAKSIPLFAYQNCLSCKERLLVNLMGTYHESREELVHAFVAAISALYDSVEVEFVKYLETTYLEKDNKYLKLTEKPLTEQRYDLMIARVAQINTYPIAQREYGEFFIMFKVLKNWCFTDGPLHAVGDIRDPHKAIQTD